jgi:hypothetical protein
LRGGVGLAKAVLNEGGKEENDRNHHPATIKAELPSLEVHACYGIEGAGSMAGLI